LAIQRTLERIYNKDVPIFLQDPEYTKEDQIAAEKFGMTIVNGRLGYEEGWLLLDESTLIVDLHTNFPPLFQLIFGITRPVAILATISYAPDPGLDWRFSPFPFNIHDWEENEIKIPRFGM
jgi:hypothetical protein